MKKQVANFLTAFRMLCAAGILFYPVYSGWFYTLYLLGGLTDMVDGTVARKTGAASEVGAKLDTTADLVFAGVSFLKILPQIHLRKWLWCWILCIAVLKISNYLWHFKVSQNLKFLHTAANKITGFCLFCLPLTLPVLDLRYSAPVVCTLATIAVFQETRFRSKASRRDWP